jgi:hypothetical protein
MDASQIRLGTLRLGRKHAKILQDRGTGIRVLTGGYGSAKTTTGAACAIDLGLRWGHQGPILATEPTFSSVTDVMVPVIEKVCELIGLPCRYKVAKHIFVIGKHKKFEIWCRGLDKPRACEGINAIGYWGDEWELYKTASLIPAMARVRVGDALEMILTGTPEGYNTNWKTVLDPNFRKKNTREYILSTRDNPFLPKSYYNDTKGMLQSSEAILEKLEGIRTAKGGRVYSRFSRESNMQTLQVMTAKKFRHSRYAICCDFNVHYMHFLIASIDDDLKCAKIIDEVITEGGTTTDQQARKTVERLCQITGKSYQEIKSMRLRAYCDSYGSASNSITPKTNFTMIHQEGFIVNAPRKNPPVEDRINTVQTLFRDNRIYIDPRVSQLTANLETQIYDEKTGEPDKKNNIDHACFIGETMVETIDGPRRIDSIVPGDLVLTRQGFKRVLYSKMTSKSEDIFELSTSIGSVFGTADHPVFTEKGIKSIDAIGYTDTLYSWQNQSLSSLRESLFVDTLNQKTILTESTTDQTAHGLKKEFNHFTEKSGEVISVKYLMDLKFITKMRIQKIIQLITLNASRQLSTLRNTLKTIPVMNCKSCDQEWNMQENSHLSGIKAKQELSFIQCLQKKNGKIKSKKSINVFTAVTNTIQNVFKKLCFAQGNVNHTTDESQASITSKLNANSVEIHSPKINTLQLDFVRVNAVQKTESKAPVFNLEIEDCHEFFANGILVHNCDGLGYMACYLWPVHSPKANEKRDLNYEYDEWGIK